MTDEKYDGPLAPHLVPGRWSRLAALPIRGLDWLVRKAIR